MELLKIHHITQYTPITSRQSSCWLNTEMNNSSKAQWHASATDFLQVPVSPSAH